LDSYNNNNNNALNKQGVTYDRLFYLGATPMFLAFFIVATLTHWDNWDPIRQAVCVCLRRSPGAAICFCCGSGCKNLFEILKKTQFSVEVKFLVQVKIMTYVCSNYFLSS
jgi:hypothetical protein